MAVDWENMDWLVAVPSNEVLSENLPYDIDLIINVIETQETLYVN